jgi:hypothetical protein
MLAGGLVWMISELLEDDLLAAAPVQPPTVLQTQTPVSCPGEDKQGLNPAFAAACGAPPRTLRVMLSSPGAVHQTDPRPEFAGRTPLHHAVQREDLGMVVTLLGAGADPNRADVAGNTPLHLLATTTGLRHPEFAARRLIEAGARVDARNALGYTPLEALEHNHDRLLTHQSLAKVLFREDPRGIASDWLELPDSPEEIGAPGPGHRINLQEAPVIVQTQDGTVVLPAEPPAAGH